MVDHVADPRLSVQQFGLLQLDFTLVDPEDTDTSLPDNTSHRAADAATDIDYIHALTQFQLGDHQPLVANLGLLQALPGRKGRKVEGLAPTEHHEFVAKVVVLLDGLRVVVARLDRIIHARPVHPTLEALDATADVRPTEGGPEPVG